MNGSQFISLPVLLGIYTDTPSERIFSPPADSGETMEINYRNILTLPNDLLILPSPSSSYNHVIKENLKDTLDSGDFIALVKFKHVKGYESQIIDYHIDQDASASASAAAEAQ